jgi:protein subunit release factor A
MKFSIPDSDDALLRECRVQVFRGSGPGGQSVNTADSAVRLVHVPSGITVVARNERSQLLNKRAAVTRLRKRLEQANYRAPRRVATRPSRGATERRLSSKRHQAQKKQQRNRPLDD